MFGFSFITTIIVMMLLATLFSIIANKGFGASTTDHRDVSSHWKNSDQWKTKAPCCHG